MRRVLAGAALAAVCLTMALASQPAPGIQDPAWAPDGKRLATSFLDRIWISGPDGRSGRPLLSIATDAPRSERDPAWSPDGKWIAYAADAGKGFDIHVASADGKTTRPLTTFEGDARWPSW